jgi:hypothetical protein
MSQPIGLLRFKDKDGDPMFVEASRVVAISRCVDHVILDVRSRIVISSGGAVSSIEPAEEIAERYEAVIKAASLYNKW